MSHGYGFVLRQTAPGLYAKPHTEPSQGVDAPRWLGRRAALSPLPTNDNQRLAQCKVIRSLLPRGRGRGA